MQRNGQQRHCRRRRGMLERLFGRNDSPGGIAPLSQNCGSGKKRICKITGDRAMCARMAAMGMYPGGEINVICSLDRSQCILRTSGGTFSLDRMTSDHILVESL